MSSSPNTDSTFSVDEGDIAVANGKFAMSYGKQCYMVQIHTAIKTLLGEILLDPSEGIPYFTTVFGSNPQWGKAEWEERVRRRINEFDFVESVEKVEANVVGTVLKYTIVVKTIDGEAEISEGGEKIPAEVSGSADLYDAVDTIRRNLESGASRPLEGKTFELDGESETYSELKAIVEALGGTVV